MSSFHNKGEEKKSVELPKGIRPSEPKPLQGTERHVAKFLAFGNILNLFMGHSVSRRRDHDSSYEDYLSRIEEQGKEHEGYSSLTAIQRVIFQLAMKALHESGTTPCIAWNEQYMTVSLFIQTLAIVTPVSNEKPSRILARMLDRFERFSVIQIRPLSRHRKIRKLIVGCGNHDTRYRLDYEYNEFARSLFPKIHSKLPHLDCDTVCDEIMYNPTVLGSFETDPTKVQAQFWPSSYYDLIYPENTYLPLKANNWKTIERVLKPGGFFLYFLYANDDEEYRIARFPAGSRLVWHSFVTICSAYCLKHDEMKDDNGDLIWSEAELINPGKSDCYNMTEWWQTEYGVYRGFVLIAKRLDNGLVPTFKMDELMPCGKYMKTIKSLYSGCDQEK